MVFCFREKVDEEQEKKLLKCVYEAIQTRWLCELRVVRETGLIDCTKLFIVCSHVLVYAYILYVQHSAEALSLSSAFDVLSHLISQKTTAFLVI